MVEADLEILSVLDRDGKLWLAALQNSRLVSQEQVQFIILHHTRMGNKTLCGPEARGAIPSYKVSCRKDYFGLSIEVCIGEVPDLEDSLILNFSPQPEESLFMKRNSGADEKLKLQQMRVRDLLWMDVGTIKLLTLKTPQYHQQEDLYEMFHIFRRIFQALNSAPARNLAVLDNTNQPFAVPKQLCAELYCRVLANHKIECRNQTLKRIIFLTQSYQTSQIIQYEIEKLAQFTLEQIDQNNKQYLDYLFKKLKNEESDLICTHLNSMTLSNPALTQPEFLTKMQQHITQNSAN